MGSQEKENWKMKVYKSALLLVGGGMEARAFAREKCLCGSEVTRNSSSFFLCDFSATHLRHGWNWISIFL